ncbi:MAG: hypothetical protein IJR93_11405 [Treponema sp.]|nr:hypothetical protein [Treponema sp.]MBQ7167541.1 hypothetical protein [Treponema sp.]
MKRNGAFRHLAGFVLLAAVALSQAHAFNARDILSADEYSTLLREGKIERMSFLEEGGRLTLAPDTPLSRKALGFWPKDMEKPNFFAEEIYLAKKTDFPRPDLATIDYAGKILRSFSTLQGIQYYSHRRGKMATLYEEAYTVIPETDPVTGRVSKVGETRGPDNTAGSADGKTQYALMDDSSLGRTVYKVSYEERSDEIWASFVNESALKLGPIKAFAPGKLRMNFVVADCGDYVVAYLTTEAAVPPLGILEKKIKESFSTRLAAVYGWFTGRF